MPRLPFNIDPTLLWTGDRTISSGPYLITGVLLMLLKYAIDTTVAHYVFNQPWSPGNYLAWPHRELAGLLNWRHDNLPMYFTLLAISLPFIWVGIMLTLHRLRSAGMPLASIVLFFAPMVNIMFFVAVGALPEAPHDTSHSHAQSPGSGEPAGRFEVLRQRHRNLVRKSNWRSGVVAVMLSAALALLGTLLSATILGSYGLSLFVGMPFFIGMFAAVFHGFSEPKSHTACVAVGLMALLAVALLLLGMAFEGFICILMAAPLAVPLCMLGSIVGYQIQARDWLNCATLRPLIALIICLPTLMAAEAATQPQPVVRGVSTEVIVDAPPDIVWRHVIKFPPLPEPDDWFFKTGIAYPLSAEMHGSGVGAVRHCVFSTGAFVEPIEVWDEPHRLAFSVTDQPPTMREWSPYEIHPPHLEHYFKSERGEFRLEQLPGNRTRLIGTTWCSNRMWPAPYWHLWSDMIIHRIHQRVLDHVRTLAERDRSPMLSDQPPSGAAQTAQRG